MCRGTLSPCFSSTIVPDASFVPIVAQPPFPASDRCQGRHHEPVQVSQSCMGTSLRRSLIAAVQGWRHACSLRSCPGLFFICCEVHRAANVLDGALSLMHLKGHVDVIRALVAQGGPSILDIQDADGRCLLNTSHVSLPALFAMLQAMRC